MKGFSKYVNQLRHLALASHDSSAADEMTKAIDAALDGGASVALRRLVDLEVLRDRGAFFTGSKLSRRAARFIAKTLDSHSVILDPACGAGDLLLACAEALPRTREREAMLTRWQSQLTGRDISSPFVEAARLRLTLLAAREGVLCERSGPGKLFREVRVACGMVVNDVTAAQVHWSWIWKTVVPSYRPKARTSNSSSYTLQTLFVCRTDGRRITADFGKRFSRIAIAKILALGDDASGRALEDQSLVHLALPGAARSERTGHTLDAVDEVRAQHLGRAGDFEIRKAAQELAEHHRDLAPSKVGAQAVVCARAAESHMFVRCARDVETVGLVEDGLVTVR